MTLVAAVDYFYIREYWVTFESFLLLCRHIDWVDHSSFAYAVYRLLFGTVVMLAVWIFCDRLMGGLRNRALI